MSETILRDKTHDKCLPRHKWYQVTRLDGCRMRIEVCLEHDSGYESKMFGKGIMVYFRDYFGWESEIIEVSE